MGEILFKNVCKVEHPYYLEYEGAREKESFYYRKGANIEIRCD